MEDIIIEKPKVTDWIAGGFTPLESKVLAPNQDWERFLPVAEYQNLGGYDRSACGAYLVTNLIEILHLAQTKIEINLSDRSLAKLGGVVMGVGGSLAQIFDEGRNNGFNYEHDWPDTLVKSDYYNDIPQEVLDKRVKFEIYREWIKTYDRELVYNSPQYAPLGVLCCYANGSDILNPEGNYNHFVTVYGAEKGKYWKIFDHYTNNKKKYAWDYEFGCVLKPTLILNNMEFKPENNHLYLLVQGPEQKLCMGIDGKLMIYDEKIDTLLNSVSRAKKYLIPTPITMEQYNSCEKVNGKGEKIN